LFFRKFFGLKWGASTGTVVLASRKTADLRSRKS
jgi:hypothetical protein